MSMYETLANNTARIYEQLGQGQAEAALQRGRIWGQTLASLGGQVANLPAQLAQQAEAKHRAQITNLHLQQAQREQAGETDANAVIASLPKNPDGTWDVGALSQKFAERNVPLKQAEPLLSTLERLNQIQEGLNAKHVEAVSQVAETFLSTHPKDEPFTDQTRDLFNGVLEAHGLSSPQERDKMLAHFQAAGSVENGLKLLRDAGPTYQRERAKIHEELSKPMKVGANEKLVIPATGEVVAEGAPKLDTETEREADAATLGTPEETPTAKQSAAAVAIHQAPAKAQAEALAAWREQQAGMERQRIGMEGQRIGLERQRVGLEGQRVKMAQNEANLSAEGVKPNSQEYRVAQDLAYGKLTFADFNRIYGRAQKNATLKAAIYDQARQLNPNFNPAAFEMGFAFAKQPKVQQQLSSLDNVIRAAPDLIAASNAAKRSGVTTLNKFVMPIKIGVGNKTFTDFKTAQIAFADELSGALGYGSATDMSREMGFNMTNANLGPEQFASAVQNVVLPFVDRKRKTMLDQMGVYGQPGMNPAATAPSGAPAGGVRVLSITPVKK